MNKKSIPNQLTLLRLVFAAVFFAVLSFYQFAQSGDWLLWLALGLFVVGMITDFFDGYLARKWDATSVFGRIMDPFVDKVMVLGALVFLAGPGFVQREAIFAGDVIYATWDANTRMISGVQPWMVVLMLARELLVTGIRGEMESRGIAFGANLWGKPIHRHPDHPRLRCTEPHARRLGVAALGEHHDRVGDDDPHRAQRHPVHHASDQSGEAEFLMDTRA